MKVHLMHRDRDVDLATPLPANADDVVQDIELDTLLDAMARGDAFLRDVARNALLCGLSSPEAIVFRQEILRDCLHQPDAVRALYEFAVEGVETKRKAMLYWSRQSPDAVLGRSLDVLALFFDVLKRLRVYAAANAAGFESEGFVRLFEMLDRELDDEYVRGVEREIRELRFAGGAHLSARLGLGNVGIGYELRKPFKRRLRERIRPSGSPSYGFSIAPRDEHGMAVVGEIRGRGVNRAANALAQSADHILAFFTMLRVELGFYVSCLNLFERLSEDGIATAFPVPSPADARLLSAQGLVDAPLALHLGASVVGNNLSADGTRFMMITGANQGGKSTFLRSLGVAQLMMQAGMFVTAESFQASVCDGVFTHFKREEDATMTHGKLDEELDRMNEIVDSLRPHSLLMCNESFAATNEREGSEIARHVVRALVEADVRVLYVTHLYDLASDLYRQPPGSSVFLRAEREPDGHRTFRVVPGEPLPTSYGEDSYRRIFSDDAAPVLASTPQVSP
jgi:hypothetical protein